MKGKKKKPNGRPTIYSKAMVEKICNEIASGNSVLQICLKEGFPDEAQVFRWLAKYPEFRVNYARAREIWADAEFEKMMHIADTPMIGEKTRQDAEGGVETTTGDMIEHRKLQVDTRKWALERMSPRKYGKRIDINPDPELPMNTADAAAADALVKLLIEKGANEHEIRAAIAASNKINVDKGK